MVINESKLTVVVVAFNSADIISSCLSGIFDKTSVYVVDNASSDNIKRVIESDYPQVVLEILPENVGFGRAVNHLLEIVGAEYVLVLNPDVEIDINAIVDLIDIADRAPEAWILSPTLCFSDGRIQRSYLPFEKKGGEVLIVDQVLGAVMLLRRKEILALGGFDENLFLYGEDEDLCFRVVGAGARVCVAEKIQAKHLYGKSSADSNDLEMMKAWHLSWARIYVKKKHQGIIFSAMFLMRVSVIYSWKYAYNFIKLNKKESDMALASIKGAYASFFGKSGFNKNYG